VSENGLDPIIHAPARLRIVVTLAALHDGDTLSFTRLQDLIGLTPGNLITHLRTLQDAGYITTEKTGNGATARTSVALTHTGRGALERYTTVLRELLDSAIPSETDHPARATRLAVRSEQPHEPVDA
jgi:DNA-binding MarR family transcriptional regulator